MHENKNKMNQMFELILCIDIGTSSVRCSAYKILPQYRETNIASNYVEVVPNSRSSRNISCIEPISGKINLFPYRATEKKEMAVKENEQLLGDLFDVIDSCVDETLSFLRSHTSYSDFHIIGLGFSSFVMNLIGVDRSGCPHGTMATMSYACNTRQVQDECNRLQSFLGNEAMEKLYRKTGTPIHASYAIPQSIDFYKTQVTAINVFRWLSISSLCIARWTGKDDISDMPISYSEASWTGLLNYKTCQWEEDALYLVPIEFRQTLPPLQDSFQVDFYIQQDKTRQSQQSYWDRWPELRSCRLFLGFGDGACANIGSRCTVPQRIAVTIGTSAAVRVCIPYPRSQGEAVTLQEAPQNTEVFPPSGLFCYRIDSKYILLGGALTDGGTVMEWIRSLLGLTKEHTFTTFLGNVQDLYQNNLSLYHGGDCSSKTQPLTLIPFFTGERSTGFRSGATGSILGITRQTSQQHLVLSCMEGIVLRLWAILKLMDRYSPTKDSLILVSGTALDRNPLWRQMLSDCTQRLVIMDPDCTEGSSRGVAVLLAHAMVKQGRKEGIIEPLELANCWQSDMNMDSMSYWSYVSAFQEKAITQTEILWE